MAYFSVIIFSLLISNGRLTIQLLELSTLIYAAITLLSVSISIPLLPYVIPFLFNVIILSVMYVFIDSIEFMVPLILTIELLSPIEIVLLLLPNMVFK